MVSEESNGPTANLGGKPFCGYQC